MRKLSPLVIAVAGSVSLPAPAQTPPAATSLRKSAAGIPSDRCCCWWPIYRSRKRRCRKGASLYWQTRVSGFARSRSMANKGAAAVAVKVVALDDHIAEVDGAAQFDAVVRRDTSVSLGHLDS